MREDLRRLRNEGRTAGAAAPGYDRVALVLQGGGALGAYQAGVYRALEKLDLHPDWVAGISIGAVNAAIIAGNPPGLRATRLEEFWYEISRSPWWSWPPAGTGFRPVDNALSVFQTRVLGHPGFFRPRGVSPWLASPGSEGALGYYDPSPLRATLTRLVDFERIRAGETRLSLGAANVRTGLARYFDSAAETIGPEHVMASSALPPAFPPVEIDGELYWDGGIESNTPLNAVLDAIPRFDTSIARFQEQHQLRRAVATLFRQLPEETQRHPEISALGELACTTTMNIVRLVYRTSSTEGESSDADFSRLSVVERIRAGYDDTISRCSRLRSWIAAPQPGPPAGVVIHDLHDEDTEGRPEPGGERDESAA